jgi:DNA-binding NarL/FixJ family response regulator
MRAVARELKILNLLGVESRTELAGVAAQRGLLRPAK